MSTIELHAVDTFEIPGRGTVHVVHNTIEIDEPNDLRGTDVLLDGTLVHVDGVETFCIGRPYPRRLPFGLLVVDAEFAAFAAEFREHLLDGLPEDEKQLWRDLR